jgi:hypothetical protein
LAALVSANLKNVMPFPTSWPFIHPFLLAYIIGYTILSHCRYSSLRMCSHARSPLIRQKATQAKLSSISH